MSLSLFLFYKDVHLHCWDFFNLSKLHCVVERENPKSSHPT